MIAYFRDQFPLIFAIIGVVLVVQFIHLYIVGEHTKKHLSEFLPLAPEGLDDAVLVKVVTYSKTKAFLYYVTPDHMAGYIHIFTRENENSPWEKQEHVHVWDHTGQPSGLIFPYWYHPFIYKD